MSDDTEESSKTEDPSAKRLEDAHKRGDVVKSQEVTTWFTLGGAALIIATMAPGTSNTLMLTLKNVIANADQFEIGGPAFGAFFWGLASSILMVALLPMALLAAFSVAGNLLQHRPLISVDPIIPKFSKISPLSGLQRLLSRESLVNFIKGLIKLSVVGSVMFFVMWPERNRLDTMITAEPSMIMQNVLQLGLKLMWATLAAVTIIALADFVYQRQTWWAKHKMTLQEVRDEYKQMEGDPKIKGRVRQIRMERSRKRMMAAVPSATVIVTNPTHYAVALKYDRTMGAPQCVAKGMDGIALKIRELGKQNNVPIVENPPLARALYASVDIDETIPDEHFKAVAQVIGYVMRLKEKSSWKS
ncbi:MAG: FlhB [Hyphomicrobiales bacterium]|nr:FlhB [Hyphomicrobiales bacterium]